MQQMLNNKKGKVDDKELTARAKNSLRNKFQMPEWATFFEIYSKGHQADCITFNMFPSRNFKIIGFEIKASRSDWMNELKKGEKADFFVGQCDEWYIVEARKGIVWKEELPEGWGLFTLKGNSLYSKVKSNLNFKGIPSRDFFVRIVKHSYEQNISKAELWEAEKKGYAQGVKEGKDPYDMKIYKEKAEIIDTLRKNGLELWHYELKNIKKLNLALKLIESLGEYGITGRLERLEDTCKGALKKIGASQKIMTDLKELDKKPHH